MIADPKNIVIIGLGLAGIEMARTLEKALPATHRLVVITESDAAYDPIVSVRSAVVPGWEDKLTRPAANLFPKNSPHVVLPSTKVTELFDHSLRVDTLHPGFGYEIDFEFAILATGLSYNNAFQPTRGMSLDQITQMFAEAQRGIKEASSVLIVGGGPTGIELAGEIKAAQPDKKVALITSGAHFTPGSFSPKVGHSLAAQLEAAGVAVHLNTRLDTRGHVTGPIPRTKFALPSGGNVEADFLIVAHGSTPNSELIRAFDPSAVGSQGYVRVQPSMQVQGHPNLFAVGDIADTLDLKTVLALRSHSAIASANLLALLAGKEPSKVWSPAMKAIIVSFGPHGGAGQLPLPVFSVVGPWLTRLIKGRTLIAEKWQVNFEH